MTYRELLLQAELKLDHNDITLGEFEQIIAPLNREVDVLDKIRTEIIDNAKRCMNDARASGLYMAVNIIDAYEREDEREEQINDK